MGLTAGGNGNNRMGLRRIWQ